MAKRRLKICILVPTHWEALMGGSQYQAKILTERLVDAGSFDVHYVARRIDPHYSPEGYTLHWLKGRRKLAGTLIQDTLRLWQMLRRIEPDVIYQRVGCAYTGVAARYAKIYGKRLVWHVASDRNLIHEKFNWDWKGPLQHLERRFLAYGIRNASAVVVQTVDQERLLKRNYNRTATAIIPNFHPKPKEELSRFDAPIRVCWVANMKVLKRPEIFARLAEDCQHLSNVEFIMIGSPSPAMQGWKDLMARVERLENLRYLGRQSQEEVNQTMAESHILVNTSDYEGFSNTFIQAWLRQVPVLSLSVNPDSVFDSHEIGLSADGDYQRLRSELVALVNDPERIRRMGLAAKEYAESNHGECNVSTLISLLQVPQRSGGENVAGHAVIR